MFDKDKPNDSPKIVAPTTIVIKITIGTKGFNQSGVASQTSRNRSSLSPFFVSFLVSGEGVVVGLSLTKKNKRVKTDRFIPFHRINRFSDILQR